MSKTTEWMLSTTTTIEDYIDDEYCYDEYVANQYWNREMNLLFKEADKRQDAIRYRIKPSI